MLEDGTIDSGSRAPDGALPVACALAPADLAGRRARWQRLSERALLTEAAIPAGVRLRFRRLEGVEAELRALAALERDCCAFAAWSVLADGADVALEVTAAGPGVDAVRVLFEVPPGDIGVARG